MLVASLLTGCGEALVDEVYLGTPMFRLGGPVVQGNPRIPSSHGDLSARLFWVGASSEAEEQAVKLDGDLAAFSMTLFDPPPSASTAFSERVARGALGFAIVVLYADRDGDGRYDAMRDLLLGASAQHVVVFTSEGVQSGTPGEALLGALSPGYHLFVQEQPSQCRFVTAATCTPEGRLVPAPGAEVPLTLWPTADEVRVPAPALDAQQSIWSVF